MSRCLEVSRLTRPARLRCRPILFTRPKSTLSPPPRSLPSYPARFSNASLRNRGAGGSGGEEGPASISRRRREDSDYAEAKELQKLGAQGFESVAPVLLPTGTSGLACVQAKIQMSFRLEDHCLLLVDRGALEVLLGLQGHR